jgi:hypothetical protein
MAASPERMNGTRIESKRAFLFSISLLDIFIFLP